MKHKLVVKNLNVEYENNGMITKVLANLTFKIRENDFVCVLGPNGCGKTTLLNAIAGFIKPKNGTVLLDGKEIKEPRKEIGMVFQQSVLFPWKTVRENIRLGPELNKIQNDEAERIASTYLQLLGLNEHSAHYPEQLSGGLKQKAGIARALANNPDVVLMDEPFASLDAQTKMKMHEFLSDLWSNHKKTILFVTHDIDEALILGDRILIMNKKGGELKDEIMNNLPKPRSYKLITEPEYISLKKRILGLLE